MAQRLAQEVYLDSHSDAVGRAVDERLAALAEGYAMPAARLRSCVEASVRAEWPLPEAWPWLMRDAPSETATAPASPVSEAGSG